MSHNLPDEVLMNHHYSTKHALLSCLLTVACLREAIQKFDQFKYEVLDMVSG